MCASQIGEAADILPPAEGYFARTGGAVLCLGAGGAATAISLHLINKKAPGDRPKRFVVVNRSPGRLGPQTRPTHRRVTTISSRFPACLRLLTRSGEAHDRSETRGAGGGRGT